MAISNRSAATLMIVLAGIAVLPAQAAIYKCKQGSQTVYSDKPCHGAQSVDTTNATDPSKADWYRAQARSLRDQIKVIDTAQQEERERRERIECQRIIRDHNWTTNTASKYQGDEWWRNRSADSADYTQKKCGKYIIPAGAGHAP